MSSTMSNNFRLSSSLKEEAMVTKKQGIVSILGSDCEKTKSAASLRRTLSADMSSKIWQSQHGFSPLKKIASSGEFSVSITDSSSSEGEEEYESREQFEIWSSIQEDKEKKELEKPGQFDIWASILSQKEQEDSKTLLPPYIHPLVKRSASSLSEKSLEICTESLGSETGSDGFSSYPPSETGEAEDQDNVIEEEEERATKNDIEDWRAAKYNLAAASKKSSPKSFPPPVPSLSRRDGASIHMRPRRDNGRLVLEAVSVPSQNNFRAQRHNGRLVLTFANNSNDEVLNREMNKEKNDTGLFEVEIENSEYDKKNEDFEAEAETEEEEELEMKAAYERAGGGGSGDVRFVMEQTPKLSGGVINVHRLALMMHKPIALSNRNPTWPNKFNELVQFEETVEELVNPITPLTQSLPPRPPMARLMSIPSTAVTVAVTAKAEAAASSFNAYEYYWKPKPIGTAGATTAECLSPITQKSLSLSSKDKRNRSILSKNSMENKKQELLVLRGNKGDYLFPLSKGCKEPRRSLLFWEPYCIATS